MNREKSTPPIRQMHRFIKKLKTLMHSWRVHSGVSTSLKQRCCSLFHKQMGKQRFLVDEEITEDYRRTISCASEDDIDKRAEVFIAKFRRQLRLERIAYSEPNYVV
ncbi:hypothetical protein PHAVU_009G101400 [Phaseolus vulgaris]|uniref:Uncharacterized protein n=1 Tax=Phaseolus vulgaris TaxID=3885 RepID=V7AY04_PHAVU|nr:hypothetical protein PHAVU_009G101400g [Phaseolus vulgaris]ESW09116.1 hypothetical protein PHAVU_009G101400g [Phaseolus vulgaris]